jgi:hypothetical protein
MAANPIEVGAPDIVDQVVLLPVDQIDMGERLRPVDRVFAEGIGRSMLVDGQITPIDVCRLPGRENWTLVAGGHRLEGARIVGMQYLRAIVVSADRADRRMREISENLLRRGLDPIERATFIADMYDLLRARSGVAANASPQQVAANARWQKVVKNEADDTSAIVADVYGWTDEIAETAGFSRRTIEYDLMLHRRLAPRTVELLRKHNHPLLTNASQLRQLARLDEAEQTGVAEYLCWPGKALGGAQPKSVADALALQRNAPKQTRSPEEKRLSAFIGSFARMSLAEKKGALDQLGGMTPKGSGIGGLPEQAEAALREAYLVLGLLLDGAAQVTDATLQSAYDACEVAISINGGRA